MSETEINPPAAQVTGRAMESVESPEQASTKYAACRRWVYSVSSSSALSK